MAWETVPYIDENTPKSYRFRPHNWGQIRSINWPVCQNCGLVLLKNDFTRWADGKGCHNRLHPEYQEQRSRAGIDPNSRRRR